MNEFNEVVNTYKDVIEVTNDEKVAIENNSPKVMPLNPTVQGWSGQQIRKQSWYSICGEEDSVLALLTYKLGGVNTYIEEEIARFNELQASVKLIIDTHNCIDMVLTKSSLATYTNDNLVVGNKIVVMRDETLKGVTSVQMYNGSEWEFYSTYDVNSYVKEDVDQMFSDLEEKLTTLIETNTNDLQLQITTNKTNIDINKSNITTNTNEIAKIKDGTTIVPKAQHAVEADHALEADNATTSESAKQGSELSAKLQEIDANLGLKVDKDLTILPVLNDIGDDDVLLVRAGGSNYKWTGKQLKEFASNPKNLLLGTFTSYESFIASHPTGEEGQSAWVNEIIDGNNTLNMYVWDTIDNEWHREGTGLYVSTTLFDILEQRVIAREEFENETFAGMKVNGYEASLYKGTIANFLMKENGDTISTEELLAMISAGGGGGSVDLSSYLLKTTAESTYAKITYVDEKVQDLLTIATSSLKFKGVLDLIEDLPEIQNEVGDFYIVKEDGSEHVWDGTNFEPFGKVVDTTDFAKKTDVEALEVKVNKNVEDISTLNDNIDNINETIEELNEVQDLSLTREFISEEVANGAVVGSICEIEKIEGKSESSANLWDYNNLELGGLAGTLNTTFESTKFSSTVRCRANDLIPVISGSQIKVILDEGMSIGIQEFDINKLRTKDSGWQTLDTIIQLQSDTYYIVLACKNNDESTITLSDFNNIMITYDTTLTSYTPYYSGFKHLEFSKLESTGVNLLNTDEIERNEYLTDVTFDGKKCLQYLDGTNGDKINLLPYEIKGSVYIKVTMYRATTSSSTDTNLTIMYSDGTTSNLRLYPNIECSIKTEDKTIVSIVGSYSWSDTTYIALETFMISYTDTEYVPYEVLDTINYGDIELKEYDYIYGVKKYSQSESVTFDGSESWGTYTNASDRPDGTYCYTVTITNTDVGYQKSICDNFVNEDGAWQNGSSGTYSDHPTLQIKYFVTTISSLAEWKTYLATNPLTIVYQTSTPTETALNIYPYLNITQNGNLTFDSNLDVENTIVYPLNTKSEVARLSALVGKLDNEIVELKSKEVDIDLSNYVEKEDGKGLSTNDYDNSSKNIVDNITTNLSSKVDKVSGKGLSTNDFTDDYVSKIATNTSDIKSLEARVDALGFDNSLITLNAPYFLYESSNIFVVKGYLISDYAIHIPTNTQVNAGTTIIATLDDKYAPYTEVSGEHTLYTMESVTSGLKPITYNLSSIGVISITSSTSFVNYVPSFFLGATSIKVFTKNDLEKIES